MICHAKRINQKISENRKMDEMERRALPLIWLVYIAAIVVIIFTFKNDYHIREDEKNLSTAVAYLANGGIAALGDDVVIGCWTKNILGEKK